MAAKIFMDMPGGLKMPAIGLGTLQRGLQDNLDAEVEKAVNTALETGYRHLDTAFVYQNEAAIGRVLKEWLSSGRLKREDLFITTKLPSTGLHEDRVEMFMKKSLANLQLDYVDLYLIHSPIGFKYVEGEVQSLGRNKLEPEKTDHIAVWKKMEEQVDAGRTKTIGLSNFNSRQIEKIIKSARIKPACLQIELNAYMQQRKLVNFCHQNGIVVVAYGILGSSSFNQYMASLGHDAKPYPDILNDPVVKKIAEKHKKTTAQVLLRHLLQKNIVSIPKSASPARLKENIDVFDFSLDSGDIESLDGLEIGQEARRFHLSSPEILNHPEYPHPD